LFVCLFVCWVNKTRAVKPLRRFHSWILSFTQDGPAFSTKTARRALQFQLRSALSTSWRAGSPFKISTSYWSHQTQFACSLVWYLLLLLFVSGSLSSCLFGAWMWGSLEIVVRMFACMLVCLYAGILSHSGDHRAHSTRSGKQSEIVRSSHPQEFARWSACVWCGDAEMGRGRGSVLYWLFFKDRWKETYKSVWRTVT